MFESLVSGFSRAVLWILRMAVGSYLLFTMIVRLAVPGQGGSIVALYSMLGIAPISHGDFYLGVSAFVGLLGVLLLMGRLLVPTGILVALVGLVNGLSEIVVAATNSTYGSAGRLSLLGLGIRDLALLFTAGLAIAAFSGQFPRQWRRAAGRTLFLRHAETPAPVDTRR